MLNDAYSCPSNSIDYALVIITKSNSVFTSSIRKCKTKTGDKHKNCTMQPFDMWGHRDRLLNGGHGPLTPLRTVLCTSNNYCFRRPT